MAAWDVRFDLHVERDLAELQRLVVSSEALARSIRGIPLPPSARHRLNRLNIVRAVRGTTGIEGARLSEEEVDSILDQQGPVLPAVRGREEQEARNASTVMSFVAELLRIEPGAPVTEKLIREIHERTTAGIDYPHNVPGQYRKHAVNAGDYTPPRDQDEVESLMERFVEWMNSPETASWHPILQAAAAHFYFISIHPFGDGNGRTARALEGFLLYRGGINPLGFYSLANYYYINRSEYIRMLDFTRFASGGDLTQFLLFAARGLLSELEYVHGEVLQEATLIAFRDYARETIQLKSRWPSPASMRLLEFVTGLGRDGIDSRDLLAGRHPLAGAFAGYSKKTVTRDLDLLARWGLIRRTPEGRLVPELELMDRFRPY